MLTSRPRVLNYLPQKLVIFPRTWDADTICILCAKAKTCIDMCITCNYVHCMARMVQVRNVPDALHRSLKARAAMAGMSLSDYLLAEIKEIAERPTPTELRERLHQRKPISAQIGRAQLVREEREAR